MRVLGMDLGSRRIGIAISDSSQTIATPLSVLTRSSNRNGDVEKIRALIIENEVCCVVVGLPISLDGRIGAAAKSALTEVAQLEKELGIPIHTYDERLTTKSAELAMRMANVKGPNRKLVVDKIAAAIILQGWLDHVDRATK